ncbi:MAG: DUF2950 domain-containing protein [Bryobacterales bacterium]|nr:DUF2950 domain-containing protein [Bryobacterales bacterium]MBV9397231.1 DUF2950 domain-containing protein [Bryobacterales bacterium]
MKSASAKVSVNRGILCATIVAWIGLSGLSAQQAAAKSAPAAKAAPASAPTGASTAKGKAATTPATAKAFDTPQQAADALVAAAEKFDVPALEQIFGRDGMDVIFTGDFAQDRRDAADFAAEAREKKKVSIDPKAANRAFLVVGNEDWPFPVPLARRGGKWFFDANEGREELMVRRIGANELDAIDICRGYVEAQDEYAEKYGPRPPTMPDISQYAQRIVSTPGKHDGLAWQNPDGTWGGPIGENIAKAIEQGYNPDKPEPYHGYFFKILKGQGPAAPLGQLDFVVHGLMIGGFALVAAPAEYGVTGVSSFIVSNDGVVYEKDLGPQTLDQFKQMERYNPDSSWTPVPRKVE